MKTRSCKCTKKLTNRGKLLTIFFFLVRVVNFLPRIWLVRLADHHCFIIAVDRLLWFRYWNVDEYGGDYRSFEEGFWIIQALKKDFERMEAWKVQKKSQKYLTCLRYSQQRPIRTLIYLKIMKPHNTILFLFLKCCNLITLFFKLMNT